MEKTEGLLRVRTGAGWLSGRWHRPLEGTIKTCRIICKAEQWWVTFTWEVTAPTPLPKTGQAVRVDVGITSLFTTSAGEKVENPRFYRTAQQRLRRQHLHIANMVRNHKLSKSILDAGWGLFKQLLTDKAASAGRMVVLVDPAFTSKTCCGCGLSLDRNHNAAINILNRSEWDAPRTA